MEFHNLVGIIGVTLILAAYLLLQVDKLSADHLAFSVSNAAGAVLILYSLYFDRNLPSIMIEVVWLMISIIGIVRSLKKRWRIKSELV